MSKSPLLLSLLLIGSCAGCATFSTVEQIDRDSPRYFTGTRVNVAALLDDRETLDTFARHSMYPAEHPLLDLPFTLIMDSVHAWWGM